MVNFDYNEVMKRHDVRVPFSLAGESDMVNVAAISKDNRITIHRELSIKLLRQILTAWDEHCYMKKHAEERKAGEFDELFDDPIRINKKGDK